MIQNSDAVGQQFLANLQLLQERTAATQAQVSSGFRISKPSDDPAALGDVLQLESDIGRVTQVGTNLAQVKGRVDAAESALQSATQLLDEARTLAAQGASTSSTPVRNTLSQQVEQILSQLVSISQTGFAGQYVFSGDNPSAPAYQLDLNNPNGVDRLLTSPATGQIQDATGITFAASRTAQDILDHRNPNDSLASDNVFAAVNSLRVALANNDQAGIVAASDSIVTAQDYLAQQLAFYGGVQNQVASATDIAHKFQLQYQASLSQERDTDMASAGVALTQEQTSYQAAVQAEAAMPRTSLFNFLQGG
jgi:flagellar hook-associated protein 3 FlgL